MNTYLAMKQRILKNDRERVRKDAVLAAARVNDTALRILADLERDDIASARTAFSELAQLLPQHLAPIDDHLKEAEIVARFVANMAEPSEEAAR